MTDDDDLLREIGRAVVQQTTGIPGPDGYLLDPAPDVGESGTWFTCPACAAVHPKSGGGGHKDSCALAKMLEKRGRG